MHRASADFVADHRRGHHFALAFFKQDYGHALANALARHIAEYPRALGVQPQMHGSFLRAVVKAGLGIGQVVAGQYDLLFHHHGRTVALFEQLVAKGHRAAGLGGAGLGGFIDHADFQGRGAPQNVFGLGSVLHARQLHHDAVQALLLNHRLGHAQLVDAVVQRGDVLLERLLLHFAGRHRVDGGAEFELGAVGAEHRHQFGELLRDQRLRGIGRGAVAKAHLNRLAIAADAAVAQVFLAQGDPQVAGQ